MPTSRRGLVAPQNTFLESIIRRSAVQHSNFILSNARVVGYPIVYSNDGFCKMTGRTRADVMQKSSTCNFMYGDLTDKETIKKVEKAFEDQTPVQVELVIYKRNRTPMWSLLQIAPIQNEKDQIVLFLCTFKDITSLKQPIEDENAKGLSRFARLARTVTRSKSVLVQVAQHLPNMKSEQSTQNQISQIAHMMSIDAEVLPQYKREAPKTPPHIILHYCTFKIMWDWVILLLTFYTAVAVPLNVAFQTQTAKDYISMVVDGIVDIVFFIDVILNFHTTFVGPGGEVVSDPKVIRMNYLKSWFIIDLLSCLPYDVINAFQQQNNLSSIFSALKVVRLLRLGRVVRKLDHYIEYGVAFLILLMLSYMLFAHWAACIWYSIGVSDARNNLTQGWLFKLSRDVGYPYSYDEEGNFDPDSGPPVTMKYISSLYYTMSSFTSVGFGNIAAVTVLEKVFTILMMVVGSLLYATIFGNVTTIFQQFTHNTARYHDMLNNVKEFMKLHQVDKSLSERVMDYVVSSWSINKGIDSEKVLSYCPKDMKADVCVHLNRSVFSEHAGFRLASEGCLRALAINFTMSHSAPGDLLIHVGESVDSLWFVVSGSLEVIQDEEVVAILGAGDVYGDAFWKDNSLGQAAANVKALTYCDLHSIRRDDLMDVLNFYQAFANSFARNMVLTYNLRHRLVFRKVADVKREQAEAEKRKNEPPIPADHPVRKMLNKFRKLSDVPEKRTAGAGNDVEKGENDIGSLSVLARMKGPMLTRVPESNDTSKMNRTAKHRPTAPKEAAPAQTAKPASKWGALKNPNQLRKTESTDSGILRSDQKLDEIGRHDSKEGTSSMSTSSTDQQLLTSLMEIKLELKEEIEHLSVKMNRLDEQIGDIIKFFSPESSPYSSSVPSSNSSRVSSMNEVAIASPQKSPITVKVREHADTFTVSSPPASGLGSKSVTGSGSSGTSNEKKRSADRRNSNGSRSSAGSRHSSSSEARRTGTPTSPPDTRGPPPVESTNILALLDPDLQRESFTDIESPPSPDAHVPQF
ncbi:potassium voltage-gated channel subfamily H member 1-like isoform X2 [Acanthaster planci]|uniref:Potassium voltage-gated channel subfamily H member 1-like isoform X2 n=1 Tax=Acanthaster planci TaxID=133434 RepID=A0A8B7Y648_ACAPL|nr:potassium voltage-gated channel subfamily H member 1-like isoform X2 [Acanthaster planci]